MTRDNDDDLVPFLDVRVIRSTPPALYCGVAGKRVWLPRGHISGKLWCTGDRGTLLIRRWVARDRCLDLQRVDAIASLEAAVSQRRLPAQLHLVRSRDTQPPARVD